MLNSLEKEQENELSFKYPSLPLISGSQWGGFFLVEENRQFIRMQVSVIGSLPLNLPLDERVFHIHAKFRNRIGRLKSSGE